jgi:hypothetical protein
MKLFELFETETFQPPSIDVGDDVLVGKFKNKKAKVTGFKKDDNNQPVLKTNKGDQKLFKPRFPKLMKEAFKAYHGTDNKIEGNFDEKFIGTGIDSSPFVGGIGMLGKGFYFTPSKRKASDYGEYVIEAELAINNPLMIGKGSEFDSIYDATKSIAGREVYRAEFQPILKKAGYDGIIKRDYHYSDLDEIVAFDADQITIVNEKPLAESKPPLKYHGTGASKDLNYRLRDNLELKDADHETAKELDAMIAPLDQDMVLWRGVGSGPFAKAKIGDMIRDAGYVSTSTSVDQARVFTSVMGGEPAMLRISIKKGTPVIDLQEWKGENEIVIPRGAMFRVDEIIERTGRAPTILLTLVNV